VPENDWQSVAQVLLTELAAMGKQLKADHIEVINRLDQVDERLDQLVLEQFNTRMEVTKLAGRVAALEGKKPNGHAVST
jgi:hypothetical protein